MGKYLFYSGSAAVLGCGIGFLLGSYIFPVVIWSAYRIMYRLGDIRIILDWKLGLISLIVSILCSMGTTIATCRYELTSVAAELMRPKAPKSGKRIILERIPFLWNRMKFLRKVSARNIFRYKQRFYMMVFGIGGCTALLLTGFGIKDSIKSLSLIHILQRRHYHGEISVLFRKRRRTGLRHRIPAWFLYFPCSYLERVPDHVPAGGYPDYSGLEAGVNIPYRLHFVLHGNNDCHLPL